MILIFTEMISLSMILIFTKMITFHDKTLIKHVKKCSNIEYLRINVVLFNLVFRQIGIISRVVDG